MTENQPTTKRQKCDTQRCRTMVPLPRVFCDPCWKRISPKTQTALADSWPPMGGEWITALKAARREIIEGERGDGRE